MEELCTNSPIWLGSVDFYSICIWFGFHSSLNSVQTPDLEMIFISLYTAVLKLMTMSLGSLLWAVNSGSNYF